jgi:hypothetical protein
MFGVFFLGAELTNPKLTRGIRTIGLGILLIVKEYI